MICRLHLYSDLGPTNVRGDPGGGGDNKGGGGSGNGSDNGSDDHSRAQQPLIEHLLYVSSQPHLTAVVFTISVTLPSLISFFTKHVLNASCGPRAMLGAGNAKMTIMWSLTRESSCPVGESLRNRASQPKEMSLITEEHTMLGQQRGRGCFSEKELKDQLECNRQRIGKGISESRNSMFMVWKKGRWFKKRSKVVVVPAWEQGSL